jgi:hypothetical protein
MLNLTNTTHQEDEQNNNIHLDHASLLPHNDGRHPRVLRHQLDRLLDAQFLRVHSRCNQDLVTLLWRTSITGEKGEKRARISSAQCAKEAKATTTARKKGRHSGLQRVCFAIVGTNNTQPCECKQVPQSAWGSPHSQHSQPQRCKAREWSSANGRTGSHDCKRVTLGPLIECTELQSIENCPVKRANQARASQTGHKA